MVARGHSIQRCCRILDVPESSFYSERRRVPSVRSVRHVWLTDVIRQVHTDARGVYGARRVHAELTKGLGINVSHGTVALLMQRANIQGITGRRKRHYVPPLTTAKDLVDRQFSRDLPNQLWVTDITEHPTPCIPVVVATLWIYCNSRSESRRSAGVSQLSPFLGRVLSSSATNSRTSTL